MTLEHEVILALAALVVAVVAWIGQMIRASLVDLRQRVAVLEASGARMQASIERGRDDGK